MARPAKGMGRELKRAIVTIKGKAREIDLSKIGLPPLRIDILKWRGHKQVEIIVLDLTTESDRD